MTDAEQTPNGILTELLNAFEEKYQPASSIQESDEQLSSHEILSLFNTATQVSLDELYQALKQRGFTTKVINNSFLWILRNK
ncbi:hypothetical protein E9993_14665 [Labilibacter sediminis]|nr:hypothetical protein E9993_14665 [Labilibacter sediminis]